MDTISVPTENNSTSAEPTVIGIDHVAIAVENLRESIRWYVECLGFTLLEERVTSGARTSMLSAVLSGGGATIVLVQGTSPDSQVSRFIEHYGPGVQHLALRVSDMSKAVARIASSGGALDTTLIEGDGLRQAFLRRDRGSGVRVEITERRGGTFTDATITQLFREFESRELF
jgi:methylmalonyl-CoA/ethylmalonyl-CoA epimerase